LNPNSLTGALETHPGTVETHFEVKKAHCGTKVEYWSCGGSSLEIILEPWRVTLEPCRVTVDQWSLLLKQAVSFSWSCGSSYRSHNGSSSMLLRPILSHEEILKAIEGHPGTLEGRLGAVQSRLEAVED
jgi:hypothetical protein